MAMPPIATKQKRRVLVIAYYWPPAGGSGVQRFLKFVKYLREYGWEPVVYVPENADYPVLDTKLLSDVPENLEVIKQPIWEPFTLYKMFTGKGKNAKMSINLTTHDKKPGLKENISLWIRGNIFIPDAKTFWIKPSVNFLTEYLKKNPVEAMVTTAPPPSLQVIGLQLHRKLNIPWVADFRDPWTEIDYYAELKLSAWADAKHKRLEKEVLTEANVVVSVGPTMNEMFGRKVKRDYEVITNGYDETDMQPNVALSKKFTLLHIGVLLRGRNHPFLWKTLGELCKEFPDFAADLEIKLIGQLDFRVNDELAANGLTQNAFIGSHIPHDKAVLEQQAAQVNMLFIDNIPTAKHELTGKFFEYMMVGRPILCIGPEDGDVAAIMERTQTGEVVGFDNSAKLRTVLLHYYHQFKQGTLNGNTANTAEFSRKNLTGKLVNCIEKAIANNKIK